MTKDKIKKSLAVCVGASCEGCAYVGIHDCCDKVKRDARACIIKQEKEIEKLKAEFKQLETNAEILARGVRDLNHENSELTEQVKQAKIDVLNELWGKVKDKGVDYKIGMRALSEEIDEMIEEIENADKD